VSVSVMKDKELKFKEIVTEDAQRPVTWGRQSSTPELVFR
jgi:hypothetical protein